MNLLTVVLLTVVMENVFAIPPKWIRIRLVPIQYEAMCPHVGRHRQACGEFESRSNQKKEAKDENLH